MTRIGMVIGTETKPSRDVMLGLANFASARADLDLRLFHSSIATTAENVAAFVATGVDGLVFCDTYREVLFPFRQLCPDHPPIVACLYTLPTEGEMETLAPCGAVILDNATIGRQAADFLLDFGLSHFAFLGSRVRRENICAEQRGAAFQARLREVQGEAVTFSQIFIGTQMPNGDYWDPSEEELARWVSSLPRPCGVFVNGDREAFRLTKVCRKLKIDVPGQLEILSINNSHGLCERSQPTLTSLEPDYRINAAAAIQMVLALIDNPALPREQRYVKIAKCRLVERGSTSVGRNRGNIVTRAREFIRAHAHEGIGVPDVVAHLGISRRLLETQMHKDSGQSPLELIQQVRLDSCCHLLVTTNLPITEVLQQSGYPLTANPSRLFRKTFGMSMSDYRAAHRGNRGS